MMKGLFIAMALWHTFNAVASAQTVHLTVDFEDLPAGTVVNDQYLNVLFSCDPGYEPRVTHDAVSNICSRPNVLTPGIVGGPLEPWAPLYVDFKIPVSNLELCVADLLTNGSGVLRVFENGTFSEELPYGCLLFSCHIDLTRFHEVTRVEIVPIVLGAKWDNLSFTYVEPSPIPAMSPGGIAALVGMTALFGAGFLWWRRS